MTQGTGEGVTSFSGKNLQFMASKNSDLDMNCQHCKIRQKSVANCATGRLKGGGEPPYAVYFWVMLKMPCSRPFVLFHDASVMPFSSRLSDITKPLP